MLRKCASASDSVSSIGQDTQDIDRRAKSTLALLSWEHPGVCRKVRSEMQCGLLSIGVLQLVKNLIYVGLLKHDKQFLEERE